MFYQLVKSREPFFRRSQNVVGKHSKQNPEISAKFEGE